MGFSRWDGGKGAQVANYAEIRVVRHRSLGTETCIGTSKSLRRFVNSLSPASAPAFGVYATAGAVGFSRRKRT